MSYLAKDKEVEAQYRAFIVSELAKYVKSPTIWRKMTSHTTMVDYGFPPYKGTKNALYKRVKRIPVEIVYQAQEAYLAELRDIPLTQKKIRIFNLIKILKGTTDEKVKCQVLKQIKEEVGEEKYLEAIAKQGKTDINLTINQKVVDKVREVLFSEDPVLNKIISDNEKLPE